MGEDSNTVSRCITSDNRVPAGSDHKHSSASHRTLGVSGTSLDTSTKRSLEVGSSCDFLRQSSAGGLGSQQVGALLTRRVAEQEEPSPDTHCTSSDSDPSVGFSRIFLFLLSTLLPGLSRKKLPSPRSVLFCLENTEQTKSFRFPHVGKGVASTMPPHHSWRGSEPRRPSLGSRKRSH